MLQTTPPQEYPVLSAGIDWLTCTAKNGSSALALERVSDLEVVKERTSGVIASPQSWLGFEGYKLEGLFFGRREHDVMLCLSGSRAAEIGPLAIKNSSNISRLDLQVTICSNGEQLSLARDAWSKFKSMDHGRGRPRSFNLHLNHPEGSTFYLNSRRSDNFGRIYDKGVESKLAPAGMVWRYEVEFKRQVAKRESLKLAPQEQLSAYVSNRVGQWMTERGVERTWPFLESCADAHVARTDAGNDVLTWFNKSLKVTVRKAIEKHGLYAVLDNLGLLKHVQLKDGPHNGNSQPTVNAFSSNVGAELARPNDAERVLLH